MTTAYPPLAPQMVRIYCMGTLPNGRPCPKMLAMTPSLEQLKGVAIKCPRCKRVAIF